MTLQNRLGRCFFPWPQEKKPLPPQLRAWIEKRTCGENLEDEDRNRPALPARRKELHRSQGERRGRTSPSITRGEGGLESRGERRRISPLLIGREKQSYCEYTNIKEKKKDNPSHTDKRKTKRQENFKSWSRGGRRKRTRPPEVPGEEKRYREERKKKKQEVLLKRLLARAQEKNLAKEEEEKKGTDHLESEKKRTF